MTATHTYFDVDKMNAHLHHHKQNFTDLPADINSYQQFASQVSCIDGDDINSYTRELIRKGDLESCTFATTSGTTGEPKILVNSIWRNKMENTYPRMLKEFFAKNILSATDIVVNLFTAGEFSTLYDGCNRLLEAVGANIVPIGKLYGISLEQKRKFLTLMETLKVNVLFGTPLAIIQCLNLCKAFSIALPIKTIIFTGEKLSSSKREIIHQYWQDAEIFGLYGHAETGFVAVQTPRCDVNSYHVFQDWYFVECLNEQIIVTDWVNPAIPIFRYRVGDRGKLTNHTCNCGIHLPVLELMGRIDAKFNFAGNLINISKIRQIIDKIYPFQMEFQVQIRSNIDGSDTLSLVLDVSEAEILQRNNDFMRVIKDNANLVEGVLRGVAKIELLSKENFIQSGRQKMPLVIDLRK